MTNWFPQRGKGIMQWYVTPRHTVNVDDLIVLINAKDDWRFGEIGAILSLENGQRIGDDDGKTIIEDCFVMHLAFPSDNHGVWTMPHAHEQSKYGFHPAPRIYFGRPESGNPARLVMEQQGRGFNDLKRDYHRLRNGSANFDEECKKIHDAYEALRKSRSLNKITDLVSQF